MAILVDRSTRVIVQGMTGREGAFHTAQMRAYGTNVVAGVTPGKGGTLHEGIPVFNTVREAVVATQATASIIFVPAPFCADAILESVASGVDLVVAITEGIPLHDMVRVYRILREYPKVTLIGPNCPGLITAGQCKLGIMPGNIFAPGSVGVVSRSGTLTYEVVNELTQRGIGQSTCVGIGGDPVIGTAFVDVLRMFHADPATRLIVMIGEIGGSDEEKAAAYLGSLPASQRKPLVVFISGRSAPPGKRMGHAGAIISGGSGGPQEKVQAFESIGVPVANNIPEIGELVQGLLAVPA